MENKREQDIRYREAEKRMKKIKGFYIHTIVYFFCEYLHHCLKSNR